jgi:hypothetical protein
MCAPVLIHAQTPPPASPYDGAELVSAGADPVVRFRAWYLAGTVKSAAYGVAYVYFSHNHIRCEVVRALHGSPEKAGFDQARTDLLSAAGEEGQRGFTPVVLRFRDGLKINIAGVKQTAFENLADGTKDLPGQSDFLERSGLLAAANAFEHLVASLQPKEVRAPSQPAAAVSTLKVSTRPGGVQVYLDNKAKGTTSEQEGELVLDDVPTGAHKVRLSLPGYKDWVKERTIAGGESLAIQATLTPAGPKPLGADEVEEALRNGISNKRVLGFVHQFGVDFALTDEIEQRLRAVGADDTLLLAITKNKK